MGGLCKKPPRIPKAIPLSYPKRQSPNSNPYLYPIPIAASELQTAHSHFTSARGSAHFNEHNGPR